MPQTNEVRFSFAPFLAIDLLGNVDAVSDAVWFAFFLLSIFFYKRWNNTQEIAMKTNILK